jgi:hypothetical protein
MALAVAIRDAMLNKQTQSSQQATLIFGCAL